MTRNCDYCKQEYSRRPSVLGKFCSNTCKGKGNLVQHQNLTYRIPKGSIPWNKNKGRVNRECPQCKKVNSILLSQSRGFCNKHCFDKYQTHKVPKTYGTLHAWVRRNFDTPSLCEHCGTNKSKKFEWANITGQYLLDRSDWARLCCQCHRRYDVGTKNRIEVLNV